MPTYTTDASHRPADISASLWYFFEAQTAPVHFEANCCGGRFYTRSVLNSRYYPLLKESSMLDAIDVAVVVDYDFRLIKICPLDERMCEGIRGGRNRAVFHHFW